MSHLENVATHGTICFHIIDYIIDVTELVKYPIGYYMPSHIIGFSRSRITFAIQV
jgi:hypothetical protein